VLSTAAVAGIGLRSSCYGRCMYCCMYCCVPHRNSSPSQVTPSCAPPTPPIQLTHDMLPPSLHIRIPVAPSTPLARPLPPLTQTFSELLQSEDERWAFSDYRAMPLVWADLKGEAYSLRGIANISSAAVAAGVAPQLALFVMNGEEMEMVKEVGGWACCGRHSTSLLASAS
jgi:hypothetical protein